MKWKKAIITKRKGSCVTGIPHKRVDVLLTLKATDHSPGIIFFISSFIQLDASFFSFWTQLEYSSNYKRNTIAVKRQSKDSPTIKLTIDRISREDWIKKYKTIPCSLSVWLVSSQKCYVYMALKSNPDCWTWVVLVVTKWPQTKFSYIIAKKKCSWIPTSEIWTRIFTHEILSKRTPIFTLNMLGRFFEL